MLLTSTASVVAGGALIVLAAGAVIRSTTRIAIDPESVEPSAAQATARHMVEREVRIHNGEIALAGSLTRPPGPGPFPLAIAISGAGPQDRTGLATSDHEARRKPELFARAGIALLRLDDRGVGGSTGDLSQATFADLAADTAAAVDFARQQAAIDPHRIGLIGSSQGALIAALVATQEIEIAFLVLFSGPGLIGRDLLIDQIERIESVGGLPSATIEEIVTLTHEAVAIIGSGGDPEFRHHSLTEEQLDRLRHLVRELRRLRRTTPFAIGDTEVSVEQEFRAFISPSFRNALAHDPIPALRRVSCPVLIVHGELDLQVHPSVNLPPVEAALEQAPTDDITIARFEHLNHLLQPASTGHPDEYVDGERSSEVYRTTASWIAQRFLSGPPMIDNES